MNNEKYRKILYFIMKFYKTLGVKTPKDLSNDVYEIIENNNKKIENEHLIIEFDNSKKMFNVTIKENKVLV